MGVLVSARPFSGGGALRASPSSRSRCRCLRPGGVLEICWIPPGPCRRRARRWGCRAEQGWLRPWLSMSKTDAGRRWCWRGRVCAVLVQRPRLRRCAADGFCGALLMRCPRAGARRWAPVFFVDDGGAAGVCSALYPLRNLDEKVSERVLYEILIQAGHVVDLHIPSDKETGRRKGFAFAEYETEEIAKYAVGLFSGLVQLNGKTLKFALSGQDKPSSNGNNPVMPKLNPIPLPKQPQFVHCSDMLVSHKPAYPVVNGGIPHNFFSHSCNPHDVRPQALPVRPVHGYREFTHRMYDYSSHEYRSALNAIATYGGYAPNAVDHGAARQPIMYPSY